MVTKTIALPEEIYNMLKARRRPKETFSDLLHRLLDEQDTRSKKNITKIFGILGENSDEWDRIEKDIYDGRAKGVEKDWVNLDDEDR
jgi:predicted CopG family antitoxin